MRRVDDGLCTWQQMDTSDRHLNSQLCTVITSNLRWLYVGSNISLVEDLIQDGEYKRWPKTQRSSQRKLEDNSKTGNAVDLDSFLRYWIFLCTWRNCSVCLWKSHVWYAYHLLYVDIPCTSHQQCQPPLRSQGVGILLLKVIWYSRSCPYVWDSVHELNLLGILKAVSNYSKKKLFGISCWKKPLQYFVIWTKWDDLDLTLNLSGK